MMRWRMLILAFGLVCAVVGSTSAQMVLPEMKVEPVEGSKPDVEESGRLNVKPTPESKAIDDAFKDMGTLRRSRTAKTPVAISPVASSPDDILFEQVTEGCPLTVLHFNIKSFQMVYRRRDLDALVREGSPLQQDICDCRPVGGDYGSCAKGHMLSMSKPAPAGVQLSDVILVRITQQAEFEKLYSHLTENVRSRKETSPFSPEPSPMANGAGGGVGRSPPDDDQSERPPGPQGEASKEADDDGCERKRKVCFDPKEKKFSVEFSIKCKNMPEVSFSTEGEGTVKVGHLSVTLSKD